MTDDERFYNVFKTFFIFQCLKKFLQRFFIFMTEIKYLIIITIYYYYYYLTLVLNSQGMKKLYYAIQKSTKIKLGWSDGPNSSSFTKLS